MPEITTKQVTLNYGEEKSLENPQGLAPWHKFSERLIKMFGHKGIVHMVGERAGLSRIDLTDLEDILRLDAIDKDPKTKTMGDETMSFHQLIEWANSPLKCLTYFFLRWLYLHYHLASSPRYFLLPA